MGYYFGIDTSNYRTSAALYDSENKTWQNSGRLLEVPEGRIGLRQSDALFQHTLHLTERIADLPQGFLRRVDAAAVSTRPRAVEGSYMPCFLCGAGTAHSMAHAAGLPCYEVSHQQGHVAASLWSAGAMELMDEPHLAWHLSGGTTELLLVEPEGKNVRCTRIGGTTDISAGQLIDRTGQLLGLPFPSGKHLDSLSSDAVRNDCFRVKCSGSEFSFSGIQNKVQQYHAAHGEDAETAAFALRCVAGAVYQATEQALKSHPGLRVVFSGGVASNSMLRETMEPLRPVFAAPQFSTDNAMGVAVLAHRMEG